MRPYVKNLANEEKPVYYDLIGVSNHFGSLNGGHYVGDALNLDNNTWYNCNDSHVSSYSGSPSLSTSSAYVLFYIQNN